MMINTVLAGDVNITQFFLNLDWAKPSWDLFIVLFFIIGSLLYGLSLGRDRVVGILVSVYMALAVVNTAPFIKDWAAASTSNVGIQNLFVVQLTSFLGSFVLLFFLLSRSALLRTVGSSKKDGRWWQTVIFSFLHVGLLISITMSFIPSSSLDVLSPTTRQIFTEEVSRFLWIVGPIIAMIVLGESPRRRKRRASSDEDDE